MSYTLKDISELVLFFILSLILGILFSLHFSSQPQFAQDVGTVVVLICWVSATAYMREKVARREGYASHNEKVLKEGMRKAGVKTEKAYYEYTQKKRNEAFHSILLFIGALFLSSVMAVALNNLYLFWIILIGCMVLIFLRNRIFRRK
jgi:drug/metabolite transporter (DMT)-like permease